MNFFTIFNKWSTTFISKFWPFQIQFRRKLVSSQQNDFVNDFIDFKFYSKNVVWWSSWRLINFDFFLLQTKQFDMHNNLFCLVLLKVEFAFPVLLLQLTENVSIVFKWGKIEQFYSSKFHLLDDCFMCLNISLIALKISNNF